MNHDILLNPKTHRRNISVLNNHTPFTFVEGTIFHFKSKSMQMSGLVLTYFDTDDQTIKFRDIRPETLRRGRRTYDIKVMTQAKDTIFKEKGTYYDNPELIQNSLQQITISNTDTNKDALENIRLLIDEYGGIDGAHHKQWLIDQILKEATGENYDQWVHNWNNGEDGPNTYIWDTEIAP